MAIEILDYRHSTEWKLAEFTEDESFTACGKISLQVSAEASPQSLEIYLWMV